MSVPWWRRLFGASAAASAAVSTVAPSAPPRPRTDAPAASGPPAVVIWDASRYGLGAALAKDVGQVTRRVFRAGPQHGLLRAEDLNVLLVHVADGADEDAIRAARGQLFRLGQITNPGAARVVVGWAVPERLREKVWVIPNRVGPATNVARLTMASSWTRHRRQAANDRDALKTLSGETYAAVEALAKTTDLFGDTALLLLSTIEQADHDAVHLLVCEPLSLEGHRPPRSLSVRPRTGRVDHDGIWRQPAPGPAAKSASDVTWNGIDAVVAAVGQRWVTR